MRISLSPAATLFHADCRDAMASLPDNSLDSIVTDPPYGLQFMGKEWDKLWRDRTDVDKAWRDAHEGTLAARARKLPDYSAMAKGAQMQETHLEWAKEAFRILKPGGHIAAFSASRTYHRMACAIEDAGFEIRDSLMWVYGTGFPKSHDVSKGIDRIMGAEREVIGPKRTPDGKSYLERRPANADGDGWDRPWKNDSEKWIAQQMETAPASAQAQEFQGFGTALKPAFEPIVLARKPLSESTVAANVLRWRTGALNIGASRIGTEGGGGNGLGSHFDKLGNTTPLVRHGDDRGGSVGRWPANVVTDGSDEVVAAFPVTSSGKPGTHRKGQNDGACFGAESRAPGTPMTGHGDSGSAARFFYSAKASKADRNGSKHPTVKPIALMEWLATLITPPGGTILDPFAGSGTTGIAATRRGFQVILCEREAEYVADIRNRFATRSNLIDLAAVRRELALLPALGALQARLSVRCGVQHRA